MASVSADVLAAASLNASERKVLERFSRELAERLGDDLLAVWLYGSRARGDRTHSDSDVDLLVIARGDAHRRQRLAGDLCEAAALAEGESPFRYSVHVHDPGWLRERRGIGSFFVGEVDRDKVVLAGGPLNEIPERR